MDGAEETRDLQFGRMRISHANTKGDSDSMNNPSTSKSTKTEQSLFEEDDEFEEFPTEGDKHPCLYPINAHPIVASFLSCVLCVQSGRWLGKNQERNSCGRRTGMMMMLRMTSLVN